MRVVIWIIILIIISGTLSTYYLTRETEGNAREIACKSFCQRRDLGFKFLNKKCFCELNGTITESRFIP